MMRAWWVAGLVVFAASNAAADQPAPPTLDAGTYKLVEVHIIVENTDASGDDWDEWPRKMADPDIDVLVNGVMVEDCLPQADQHDVRCAVHEDISIDSNTEIRVVVTEFDAVTEDDPVGTATLTGLLNRARIGPPIPMDIDGRIASATVTFGESAKAKKAREKRAERDADGDEREMNMWDASRYRFIGLGVGVAAGLLMVWLLGGFLWPPDEHGSL
jgi:hypothetical protein